MNGDLTSVVRGCIKELDEGGTAAIANVITRLSEAGAQPSIHVGRKDLSNEETVEWYAGQVLAVLEEGDLFAVNGLIATCDLFAPTKEPTR